MTQNTGDKLVRSSLQLLTVWFQYDEVKKINTFSAKQVEGLEGNTLSVWSTRELTECLTAVQGGSKAAGVGVNGNVGGRGAQQRVSDDDRVDDALTGDGVEHGDGQVWWKQRHDLWGEAGDEELASSTSAAVLLLFVIKH